MDEHDDEKLDWTCEYCDQTYVDGTGFRVVSDQDDEVWDICEKCFEFWREHQEHEEEEFRESMGE